MSALAPEEPVPVPDSHSVSVIIVMVTQGHRRDFHRRPVLYKFIVFFTGLNSVKFL